MRKLLVFTALLFTQLSVAAQVPQGSVSGKTRDLSGKIYSDPGVTVSGKVIDKSGVPHTGSRAMTLSPVGAGKVSGVEESSSSSRGNSLEVAVRDDGTFEFTAVPRGEYILRLAPFLPTTKSTLLDLRDHVRNLEVVIPFQLDVTGRVLLEGRVLSPNTTIQAVQSSFSSATGIRDDGTFKLRLIEGENRVSIARLPVEFSVRKIMYGDVDITNTSLNVETTTAAREIVVTLETLPLGSIPGVKVSGRMTGNTAPGAIVLMSLIPVSTNGRGFETTAKADGTFEFPRVTPGVYMLVANAPWPISSPRRVVVGDTDLSDIDIAIPARSEAFDAPTP